MKKFIPALFLVAYSAFSYAEQMNVVLIVADDLGYGDLSMSGATAVKTPNIDSLAASGSIFSQGYATASTCTPSRYSMFTGEYAWRQKKSKTGILDGDDPLCIPTDYFTLPKMFKSAGYRTAAIGKWHLGLGDGSAPLDFNSEIKPNPRDIGFDYSFIIPATVDRVPSVWLKNGKVVDLDPADPIKVSYVKNIGDTPTGIERPDLLKQKADKQHSGSIINGISRIGYMSGGHAARFQDEQLPQTVVDKSVKFIEDNKSRPFFMYVGLFEPHVPRTVDKRFEGASSSGIRGDVIAQADWQVGEIVKALKNAGLLDKTIVIFTSDNGPVVFDGYFDFAERDLNSHKPAANLRGGKYRIYEGGMRVPFIVYNPKAEMRGVCENIVGQNDFLATFAEMTSQRIPQGQGVDSISILTQLFDVSAPATRTEIVLQSVRGKAIRMGDWKFLPQTQGGNPPAIGAGANPEDKRFQDSIVPEDALYNLKSDPSETENAIEKHPDIALQLKKRLAEIENAK